MTHLRALICVPLLLAVVRVIPLQADSLYPDHAPGPFGEYEAGQSVSVPMVRVPGAVPGQPAPGPPVSRVEYDVWMGKYPITNAQYAAFLNDAQRDGGATGRGSYIQFDTTGEVRLANGTTLVFQPQSLWSYSRITYDGLQPVGSRYRPVPSFEQHPVQGISWYGAVKFCNWLTIDSGLGESARAYSEGTSRFDWRPITMSGPTWPIRDLNDAEREVLVTSVQGYRLPMDNLGIDWDFRGPVENPYNEWYKAFYDPAAPDQERFGILFAGVSRDHWKYGFGRDTLTGADANFRDSSDPFDNDTTPVGFYDGSIYKPDGTRDEDQIYDRGDFITNPNGNIYGLYDLTGNVTEWGQDIGYIGDPLEGRVSHGGGWSSSNNYMLVGVDRGFAYPGFVAGGFRVLAIPGPATLALCLLAVVLVPRRSRRLVR